MILKGGGWRKRGKGEGSGLRTPFPSPHYLRCYILNLNNFWGEHFTYYATLQSLSDGTQTLRLSIYL